MKSIAYEDASSFGKWNLNESGTFVAVFQETEKKRKPSRPSQKNALFSFALYLLIVIPRNRKEKNTA